MRRFPLVLVLPTAVLVVAPVAADVPATQPSPASTSAVADGHHRHGHAHGRRGPGAHMADIHALLDQHDRIQRTVEEIPGGVRTRTTTDDPALAESVRRHVAGMKARFDADRPIRRWDPLFAELFEHRHAVSLTLTPLPEGVEVTATADDSEVVLLLRQHARTVSEFARDGRARAHQSTTLPDGYAPD